MIINISGADFSSNNLGQVEIPFTPNASTREILSHYTKTLTTAQQKALQTFITNLTTAGVYAKIDHLLLPVLANDASEALYDIVGGSAISATGYTLETNGLTATSGTAQVANTRNLQDCHIFGYNTETIQSHMTDNALAGVMTLSTGNTATQIVKVDTAGKNASQWRNSANSGVVYCAGGSAYLSTISVLTLIGVSAYDGKFFLYKDSASGFSTYTYTPYDKVNTTYNILTETQGVPFGLFSTGQGLSLTECQTYESLASTFMSAFITA